MIRGWWRDSIRRGALLYAPRLWEYELASTICKLVALAGLTVDEADQSIQALQELGVRCVDPDPELHRSALRWAAKLGQTVAYDGQYLALAERLRAEVWTADRRLVDKARAAGADWVRWVGDEPYAR